MTQNKNHSCILLVVIALLIGSAGFCQGKDTLNSVQLERISNIRNGLNSLIFVNRFESIESPCLYMDSADDHFAYTGRKTINSSYRTQLRDSIIDPHGVKCLSSNYAKYLQFIADSAHVTGLTIEGRVKITYGYPASSIMQYLCKNGNYGCNDSFFVRLLKSNGWFRMYPDKDKYVLALVIQDKPYDCRDTAYAFLEITSDFFDKDSKPSYNFIFDRVSLYKGDKNNQLSLRFTSTNIRNELMYYTRMVHDILNDQQTIKSQAYAIWLTNYLNNPACIRCNIIYKQAKFPGNSFTLPNTSPQPAH